MGRGRPREGRERHRAVHLRVRRQPAGERERGAWAGAHEGGGDRVQQERGRRAAHGGRQEGIRPERDHEPVQGQGARLTVLAPAFARDAQE